MTGIVQNLLIGGLVTVVPDSDDQKFQGFEATPTFKLVGGDNDNAIGMVIRKPRVRDPDRVTDLERAATLALASELPQPFVSKQAKLVVKEEPETVDEE